MPINISYRQFYATLRYRITQCPLKGTRLYCRRLTSRQTAVKPFTACTSILLLYRNSIVRKSTPWAVRSYKAGCSSAPLEPFDDRHNHCRALLFGNDVMHACYILST